MSWRFQLSKGTAADPRCEGRYRLRGFSVGCCGRTGQLCDALEGCAARNSCVVDSCHLRTGDHPGGSCGCRRGEAVGVIDVADRFIAHFTIVNASTAPMTDWRLEFDLPAGESVSHTWSSTLVQYGTHYVLTPANWNRIIAPGGSATGGLRGVLTGFYTPPSNCVLNGQYTCT